MMLYHLCEFELLRSTNAIAKHKGGCHLGSVGSVNCYMDNEGNLEVYTGGTYRNQWLISVELHDNVDQWDKRNVAPGDHQWEIRLGFCQTNITRAPNGGFGLTIPAQLLALCPTCDHVVDLFDCMIGEDDERQHKLDLWYQSVMSWREQHQPIILDMNALVRDAALNYSMERALIE